MHRAASVPGAEEPLAISGDADVPLLFKLKFAATLGLFPDAGTGKVNTELPVFSTVTAFGLSLLVEPTAVEAKPRLGGSVKSSFNTTKFPPPAI